MLVAVYGTLKRGRSNSGVMHSAGGTFIGTDRLQGYEMYSGGGFPVVYPTDNQESVITVEVFEVEDVMPLDRLEGHPRWYRRVQVPTVHGEAWIYLMQDERYKTSWELLTSGEF